MKHADAEAVTRIVMQILKERRESKGLSYRKLAKKSGISNRYLSMIENGEYNPTLLQLLRIAAALGLKLGPVVSRAQREWKAQKKLKP
jgi:transcriptional regulator with XRE-family HTH domain